MRDKFTEHQSLQQLSSSKTQDRMRLFLIDACITQEITGDDTVAKTLPIKRQ